MFHTADVSGVVIPTLTRVDGHLTGRWELYLRWQNGKREARDLIESSLSVPHVGTLWFKSLPGPSLALGQTPGWSSVSRRDWLRKAPPSTLCSVYKRVRAAFDQFLEFPRDREQGALDILALWTILTYTFPAWPTIPYLHIAGPLGSGKTRVFELLSRIVFRPLPSSNMTAPCLFRTLDQYGGTLLLDEAERLGEKTADVGEIRSILLSGNKAGSPARRLERTKDHQFVLQTFDVFGPKAIAGIATLPEQLESRCVTVAMFRADSRSRRLTCRIDADPSLWSSLRDELHTLALEHGPTWVSLPERADVCPATLVGRNFDVWQPILALAAVVDEQGTPGLLPRLQEYALRSVEKQSDDIVPEADEILLQVLARAMFKGTNPRLTAKDILEGAKDASMPTFPNWTARRVASTLKSYDITTRRSNGKHVYDGVTVEKLRRIENAYHFDLQLEDVPYVPSCP